MIERIAPCPRRINEDAQILPRRTLPDEIIERLGAERRVDILGRAGGGEEAIVAHSSAPKNSSRETSACRRIPAKVPALSGS